MESLKRFFFKKSCNHFQAIDSLRNVRVRALCVKTISCHLLLLLAFSSVYIAASFTIEDVRLFKEVGKWRSSDDYAFIAAEVRAGCDATLSAPVTLVTRKSIVHATPPLNKLGSARGSDGEIEIRSFETFGISRITSRSTKSWADVVTFYVVCETGQRLVNLIRLIKWTSRGIVIFLLKFSDFFINKISFATNWRMTAVWNRSSFIRRHGNDLSVIPSGNNIVFQCYISVCVYVFDEGEFFRLFILSMIVKKY